MLDRTSAKRNNTRFLIGLSAGLLLGAALGAFSMWQHALWLTVSAEGIRNVAVLTAMQAQQELQLCATTTTNPKPTQKRSYYRVEL